MGLTGHSPSSRREEMKKVGSGSALLQTKDGRKTQVYISPAWHDIARYCVKTILFYSDEVRHLAAPKENKHYSS